MKTKEQILGQVANLREPYYLNDVVIVKHALEAMQLYSDQQNKEKDAEIQRLTKEVEELKETKALRDAYANKIERQNLRIEILKNDVVTLDSELTRLRELLRRAKRYVLFFEPINELQEQDKSNLLTDIKQRIKP